MVLSAGMLLYEIDDGLLRVLIAHMGGPFWAKKDECAWSIPKGEYATDEDPRAAAAREFEEEMGSPPPGEDLIELGTVRQPSGKKIIVYALESGFHATDIRSNLFEMEWPARSGTIRSFPEVDRAEWVDCATARVKLVAGQVAFLDRLLAHLASTGTVAREQ
jgi:predicted NUDIX family NTP pyrophosphohydrolase